MMLTRALPVFVLVLASCHGPAATPPASKARKAEPPSQPPVVSIEQSRVEPASLPLQIERDDPEGSACEWSCADVHDCALLADNYTLAEAASIELGCVDACLHTPERATLFGCSRPPSLEPGTCSPFLDCVAASWPDGHTLFPAPSITPRGDGCKLGCEAFAHCWDQAVPADKIERCAEQCRQKLDQHQQQVFGECAEEPGCEEIMACVQATPGA